MAIYFQKYIVILFIHMLNYDKAYFQKESKVYIIVNILTTFQKSMLLYQSIVKKQEILLNQLRSPAKGGTEYGKKKHSEKA